MTNYTKTSVNTARVELHNILSLTGSEISINVLPKGASVPFMHSHKHNEEVYAIIEGSGKVVIDDEEIALTQGDWIRISCNAKRQLSSNNEGISYICIQTKENSLDGNTQDDAIIY